MIKTINILTQEEKRIKLAEAGGWELKSNGLSPMWSWQNESLTHRIRWVANKEMASQGVLPDYFNDLNAVHELKKTCLPMYDEEINGIGVEVFPEYLCKIVGYNWELDHWGEDMKLINATPAQSCEAIGKALNLW